MFWQLNTDIKAVVNNHGSRKLWEMQDWHKKFGDLLVCATDFRSEGQRYFFWYKLCSTLSFFTDVCIQGYKVNDPFDEPNKMLGLISMLWTHIPSREE